MSDFRSSPEIHVAVEEAVRLREKLKDAVKSIKVLTVGPPKAAETLRTALAMGADSGIHIELPETAPSPEPLSIAKLIKASIEKQKEPVDLVIMGKQAIDDDAGQTGQMLAGLLGWSQATFASKVEVDEANKVALVTREIDGGLQEVRCKLPLVVTTDLRLNGQLYLISRSHIDANVTTEPRYASLPNIMKAKKKPIEKFQPSGLGVDVTPILETIKVTEPPKRVGGTKVSLLFLETTASRLSRVFKVESVDELVAKLKAAGITAV